MSESEQPVYSKELPNTHPVEVAPEARARNWPMLVALLIAALAFAILVVLAARWVYHNTKNDQPYVAPASTNDIPKAPSSY